MGKGHRQSPSWFTFLGRPNPGDVRSKCALLSLVEVVLELRAADPTDKAAIYSEFAVRVTFPQQRGSEDGSARLPTKWACEHRLTTRVGDLTGPEPPYFRKPPSPRQYRSVPAPIRWKVGRRRAIRLATRTKPKATTGYHRTEQMIRAGFGSTRGRTTTPITSEIASPAIMTKKSIHSNRKRIRSTFSARSIRRSDGGIRPNRRDSSARRSPAINIRLRRFHPRTPGRIRRGARPGGGSIGMP
jgi:hypothetical protein